VKATCHREGLLSACQLAVVAVATRDLKPILKNLKAIAETDRCILMATDLELGIRIEVRSVHVEEAGEAILPAAKLIAILRESTDEDLTVEADAKACFLRGQATEFEMPSENPADFPDLPSFAEDKHHQLDASLLREMIRRTVFATAKENPRYAMTGVLWELEEKQCRLVATDGRRLAIASAAVSLGGADTKGQTHIVPTKAMQLLERILQDGAESVKVCLRPNDVLFRTERATLYSRLVEGRFPNYREVLPKKPQVKVPLVVGPFYTAVRQVAIMVDEESKRIICNFGGGKLTLRAEGASTGRSRVEIPLDYDGKAIKIAFDPQFLADMLRVLEPDAELMLELVDSGSPALFRCGNDYAYVVMPVT
jgi:DNA polymerase-3 subunit beta